MRGLQRYNKIVESHPHRAAVGTSWRARRRAINWIAAIGCFACAAAYTVASKPLDTIVVLIVLGLVNLAFLIAR
jgi:hypothetical protein